MVPYYLIETRGIKRGALLLLLAAAIYIGAYVITAALFHAMQPG